MSASSGEPQQELRSVSRGSKGKSAAGGLALFFFFQKQPQLSQNQRLPVVFLPVLNPKKVYPSSIFTEDHMEGDVGSGQDDQAQQDPISARRFYLQSSL